MAPKRPLFPRVPASLPVLAQFIIRDHVDPSAPVCLLAQGQHNQSSLSSGVVQTGLRLRGARSAVPERITAQRAGVQKCLVHFCLLPCVSCEKTEILKKSSPVFPRKSAHSLQVKWWDCDCTLVSVIRWTFGSKSNCSSKGII